MSPNARQVLPGSPGGAAVAALRERHNERFIALARQLRMAAEPAMAELAGKLQRHEMSRVGVLDQILSRPHERLVRPALQTAPVPGLATEVAESLAELAAMTNDLARDELSPVLGRQAPLAHAGATPLELIGRFLMKGA